MFDKIVEYIWGILGCAIILALLYILFALGVNFIKDNLVWVGIFFIALDIFVICGIYIGARGRELW